MLLEKAAPQNEKVSGVPNVGGWELGAGSVAKGGGVGGARGTGGNQNQFFALDAATGAILWHWGAGVSVNAGPAIVRGHVYWGSGYARSGVEGSGNNNELFAFSLGGE